MYLHLRKSVVSFFVMTLSVLSLASTTQLAPLAAQAATLNTVIKGSGPTLYWYDQNGHRYVFPNSQTYFSWYPSISFSQVQTISDQELYTLPLGGNVTYRPGAKLVKVMTDPRVYAVSRYGVLRWISSESLAQTLYGNNWASWVDDIPDAFFTNYTIGPAIYSATDFNVSNQYNSVTTPGDNIGAAASNNSINTTPSPYIPTPTQSTSPAISANISLTSNATTFPTYNNDALTLTATVSNASISSDNLLINIYQEGTAAPIQTCWGVNRCVITRSMTQGQTTVRYYADVLQLGTNTFINRSYSSYITVNGSSTTNNTGTSNTSNASTSFTVSSFSLTANRTTSYTPNTDGDLVLTATVQNPSSAVQNITIRIYDSGGTVLQTCTGSFTCIYSTGIAAQNTSSLHYHAVIFNERGQTITAYSPTITVYSYPKPSTSIGIPYLTAPVNNQVLNNYPRTATFSWKDVNSPRYKIQIDCTNCGATASWGYSVANYQTSFTLSTDNALPGDNVYSVRVKAVANDGTEGPWSDAVAFSFVTPTINPAPTTFDGTVSVNVDKTGLYTYDPETITATVNTKTSPDQYTITIYDQDQNVITSCGHVATCAGTVPVVYTPVVSTPSNYSHNAVRYSAIVRDLQGRTLPTAYSPDVTVAPAWQAAIGYQDLPPSQDGGRQIAITTTIDQAYALQMGGTPTKITVYDTRFYNPIGSCDKGLSCNFTYNLSIPSQNEALYAAYTIGTKIIYSPYQVIQP